jgi:hypothetical protein
MSFTSVFNASIDCAQPPVAPGSEARCLTLPAFPTTVLMRCR